jgi:NAD-dependent DNA ligase
MRDDLDEHGQPHRGINYHRVLIRSLDEMLGICKGVICDGRLPDVEIVALDEWLAANPETMQRFPGDLIFNRLRSVLADGVVDDEEREDLKALLEEIAGGDAELITKQNRATQAAFPNPLPTVLFESHTFCFTGRFAYGPRTRCEQAVSDRGGRISPTVTKKTQYLIVGTFGSRDWLHSVHGRKIETALAYGCVPVPEDHWVEALNA